MILHRQGAWPMKLFFYTKARWRNTLTPEFFLSNLNLSRRETILRPTSGHHPATGKQMINNAYKLFAVLCATQLLSTASAEQQSILVQSTTSTANSGLYDYLLPHFESETGSRVNVVAVGTGQAIKNASNCDADVLLVHAKSAEEQFVRDGYGVKRYDLMYNDFVLIGPANDPAQVGIQPDAATALQTIAATHSVFASRGDNSGTHKKEIQLWQHSGTDPTSDSGKWYRETGSGMGATLNIAVGMGAYTMTDRATWINFKNRGDHKVLLEGDENPVSYTHLTLPTKA